MVVVKTIRHLSKAVSEFYNITEQVHGIVEKSGIKNGFVAVITSHTTTGIMVNEALPCVEQDLSELMDKLVPLNEPYLHAHFLPTYGATSNNSQGHLKSALTGNHCLFPVLDGKIVCGGAQEIYLAEYDGPQARKVFVEVMGE
ncbi:hypothetical protein CAFE_26990 [Caprobacter fermentans]|uniref:Secondary thiamine-phosphate synthase enzyme n=1 Tax=Caproicibacter fermentans TaxID=2576756 RepID=A0A6N8I2U7_9FIRM|nr:secondary thiamine-phosphate synthase enzyme YjbQ [Caproicibacter fermentans]MVB11970.1 hypothetical protein [Caproicibacter fermentans]OCM99805.1 secondary thiamine-phosphate synthase enzyme [Clostridium sp. W14A]